MVIATAQDPVLLKYRDFILFLLYSGARPSEAIGLRWEHIDFSRNELHICESLRVPMEEESGKRPKP